MNSNSLKDLNNINLQEIFEGQSENAQLFDILKDYDLSDSFDYKDGNYRLKLKFINRSNNPNPEHATPGSSGFDFRANLDDEEFKGQVNIPAGKMAIIPTGIYVEIPEGFEIQVRPRSGMAAKFGLTVLNTPGTIDSDYRGEIKIILFNTGAIADYTVNHGDRIAQGVIQAVHSQRYLSWVEVDELSTTKRNAGGFGHTGRQ